MSALLKAPGPQAPTDPVRILNGTAKGLRLPAVGPVEFDEHIAVGLRIDNQVIALPGSHAIGVALDIAECTVDQTQSIDHALLALLITRVDSLRRSLSHLLTHDAPDATPARLLQ